MANSGNKIKKYFFYTKKFLLEFKDDNLLHYAASLSFHTILAFIPILLVSFSVFTKMKSFETYYDMIKSFLFTSILPSHQEVVNKYIEQFINNTAGMGAMGAIVVLYVSIMFFIDYENVVSKIFNSPRRSFWESLSTYWTMMTLTPVALGVSIYLSNEIQNFLNTYSYTSWINILSIFPFLVIWVLFFILYQISAKIKIEPKFAMITSFVTSLAWYISKILFVYYVMYNKTYLSIYGSFSIVIFFFLWIYLSWIIFIYGLKLCAILHKKDELEEELKKS